MKGRKVKERNLLTFLSHWVKPILRHTLLLNLTPDVNNAFFSFNPLEMAFVVTSNTESKMM